MNDELKKNWTDKLVVVQSGVPELRRFEGLTGTVKTVNWNGRALVQFDGPVDISWYDIEPSYLTIVTAPLPKKAKPEAKAAPAAAAKPASAGAKPAGGKSPLEMAREQAAKKAGADPTAEKKLSPLEQARLQGGAKTSAAPAITGDKKLSPIEQARLQGAAKAGDATAAAPVNAPAPPVSTAATAPAKAALAKPKDTAAILELARQQGAVKKN